MFIFIPKDAILIRDYFVRGNWYKMDAQRFGRKCQKGGRDNLLTIASTSSDMRDAFTGGLINSRVNAITGLSRAKQEILC